MFFTHDNLFIEFLQCVSILEEEGHRQHRFQPSAQVKDITVHSAVQHGMPQWSKLIKIWCWKNFFNNEQCAICWTALCFWAQKDVVPFNIQMKKKGLSYKNLPRKHFIDSFETWFHSCPDVPTRVESNFENDR